ncbi:MAG: rhodanese-like domain-containing protein [Pyrinomonadaceae bacterium]
MKFKQFYLGCLAHASYYLSSNGEAAVIDPQRDVTQYLDEAEANGDKIKYVIETHSHADFVSGHVELAKKTGAKIIFGQRANTEFETLKVKDGDELSLGDINLKFLETPGHTPEGITILAEERSRDTPVPTDAASALEMPSADNRSAADMSGRSPIKMFTGDTLFIGDVGRPDLIGSKGFTAEQMGSMLYDSLHEKILPLPDDTLVYPAHGAGSLCGKSLSSETFSTLGEQRRTNYALRPMSREEFIKAVASDQPEVPAYFPVSASQNLKGSADLADIPKPERLDSEQIANFDGVVIDVRPDTQYGAGHVPNSINIGLGGQFASWAGTLIPVGTPIAIVAETGEQVDEAVMRLARVGEESVKRSILIADFAGDKKVVEQVAVDQVAKELNGDVQFVDVRRPAEHACGHAVNTLNIPLNTLSREIDRLNPDKPTYVICQSGYRSSLGTSILENAGFEQVYNVTGGTKAWLEAGLPSEETAAKAAS